MWSNKGIVIVFSLLPLVAFAERSQCPSFLHQKENSLANAKLFDAPVSDMAELVPDYENGATWNIDGYRASGRPTILLCEYKNRDRAEITVHSSAERCYVSKKAKLTAWCK